MDDDHIYTFINSNHGTNLTVSEDLGGYIDSISSGLVLKDLKTIIVELLPHQIQLRFSKGLLSPRHKEARESFQLLIAREQQNMSQGINSKLEEICQKLSNEQYTSQASKLQGELERLRMLDQDAFAQTLEKALEQPLGDLETLINEIIETTISTDLNVCKIIEQQQELLRRTKRIYYLFLLVPLTVILSVGGVEIMNLRASFNLTIMLHGWLGKEHIPLRDMGSLTLTVGGRTYEGEVDSQGKVLFADLPYDCLGKTARVRIDDTEGMPYYCCDSTLVIKKGEILYLLISILGIDRAIGVIKDEETQSPIPGAVVHIAGLERHTDSLGRFDFEIPLLRQAEEQEIEISKAGYQNYRATHTMIGRNPSRIFLHRQ